MLQSLVALFPSLFFKVTPFNYLIKFQIQLPEEIVINSNPDNLPWYLYLLLKNESNNLNLLWHLHSSVPANKVFKAKEFTKVFNTCNNESKINFRLIFNNGN